MPSEKTTRQGQAWDQLAKDAYGDELLANLPPSEHYGDFGMFEDGVGIIRSFVDDWEAAAEAGQDVEAAEALRAAGDEQVKLQLKGALNPMIISPMEGDKYTYLVLPVRLKAND